MPHGLKYLLSFSCTTNRNKAHIGSKDRGSVGYLTVHTEHVQGGGFGATAVEELFERQQDAGLQRPVVLW